MNLSLSDTSTPTRASHHAASMESRIESPSVREADPPSSPESEEGPRWVGIRSSREPRRLSQRKKKGSARTSQMGSPTSSDGFDNGDSPTPEALGASLWEEDEDPDANIMLTREGDHTKLVAASLNKLIIKMTSKDEYGTPHHTTPHHTTPHHTTPHHNILTISL